jgi:hypothetical protein
MRGTASPAGTRPHWFYHENASRVCAQMDTLPSMSGVHRSAVEEWVIGSSEAMAIICRVVGWSASDVRTIRTSTSIVWTRKKIALVS